jgi:hypothetical protein
LRPKDINEKSSNPNCGPNSFLVQTSCGPGFLTIDNLILTDKIFCEAFHSKFNALFYSAHPNIFVFIDVLKNAQKDTNIKLRSRNLNFHRTIIIEKETFIKNAMKRLEENQIDKFEFIHHTSLYQCHNTYEFY